ncbi:MAG: transcriptional repressor LexA [Chloroflexi bacterium]|nr:transcriptional repressor LexA [Chloroflexota bacterium]
MKTKGKLSPRQDRIFEYIREFMDDHQFPPTVRDIQAGCEISSTSVVDYNLHILQREGYLRRLPEVSRGIELVGVQRGPKVDMVSVPLVGSIAAGEPLHIPAAGDRLSDEFETLDLPAFLTGGRSNVYGLRVKGDSMIDAFITDGDLVLMEPTSTAEAGDMVAAEIVDMGEVTLKRFFLEGDMVRLQPENASMEPIIVPADRVAVRGRVVGVIRTL